MRIVGIDLAGSENNNTGLCVLDTDGDKKTVRTVLLKSNQEILIQLGVMKPDLVAVDAPLSDANNKFMRKCDEELRSYGTLPQNLRGMTVLVERGVKLSKILRGEFKVIEVFPTATAKILGFFEKADAAFQKNLIALGLDGDIKVRMLSRDELDAISAALTGYLYLEGKTEAVGDEEGKIVIPKV